MKPFAAVLLACLAATAYAGKAHPRDAGSLRMTMLAAHNSERAARGVPVLQWSDKLAGEAQERAAALAREVDPIAAHHQGVTGKKRGENLWVGTRGAYSFGAMAGGWLAERSIYIDAALPNISTTGNWADAGHYSQMIWRTTTQLGCALASNDKFDLLLCRYDPPGNIAGRAASAEMARR